MTISLAALSAAESWPYNRYHGVPNSKGAFVPQTHAPEYEDNEPKNGFGQFLHGVINHKTVPGLGDLFVNGSIPEHAGFDQLREALKVPPVSFSNKTLLDMHRQRPFPQDEATRLLSNLPFELDPKCTADKTKW